MNKEFHNIELKVFVKPEDNYDNVKNAFFSLIPYSQQDVIKEKINFVEEKAEITNDRNIVILSILFDRQRHIRTFFDFFKKKLSLEQKNFLVSQLDSRVDDESNFFIRLDKDSLINDVVEITDSGNCFHLRFLVASFPSSKSSSVNILEKLLLD